MVKKVKIDMRFNETRDAIKEIADAVNNCPLNDNAIALLVSSMSGAPNKTQVLAVLQRLRELEKHYLKPNTGAK